MAVYRTIAHPFVVIMKNISSNPQEAYFFSGWGVSAIWETIETVTI